MTYMGSVEKPKEATFRKSFSFHKGLDKHKSRVILQESTQLCQRKEKVVGYKILKDINIKSCGLCGILLRNPRVITSHNIMRDDFIWEEWCQGKK